MPIGPSHGARGGGSSFGGGSRSSGSSHRSGGSNLGGAILGGLIYGLFAGRRRRRYENGANGENQLPYRPRPTKYLVFAIIFAVFAAFTMSIRTVFANSAKSYQAELTQMEKDYEEYKAMFGKATETGYVDGSDYYFVTDASYGTYRANYYSDNPTTPGAYLDFQKDGVSYYFIVYEYYLDPSIPHETGESLRRIGTTYTQFAPSQLNSPGQIRIAYHYNSTTKTLYSMNLNYDIEECAEYEYTEDIMEGNKSTANTFLIVFIVELGLVALFVLLYIKKLKKYKKLVKQDEELFLQKRQAETEKAQAEAQEAQYDAQRKNRFCQYCGSQIDENTNTCTSCGAKFSSDN